MRQNQHGALTPASTRLRHDVGVTGCGAPGNTARERYRKQSGDSADLRSMYVCMYGNNVGYTVILEGILSNKKYGAMLRRLLNDFQGEKLIYYFDVSFEETVRRHATKPNAHEFGESEMRQWWKDQDVLNVPGEQRIGEQLSQAEIVDLIHRDVLVLSGGVNTSASHM